jgi:hypothetical protein
MNASCPSRRQRLAPFAALDPRYDTRNVLSRSRPITRGNLSCLKASPGGATTEATLEPLFVIRAQASPAVVWFETQPIRIRARLGELTTRYTPDAAAGLLDGRCVLVEVKPKERLRSPDTLRRLIAIRRQLEAQGLALRFATEVELDRPEENIRIRYVKSHARIVTANETDRLKAQVRSLDCGPLSVYIERLGSLGAVLHLVAVGHLFLDYSCPIDATTQITKQPTEVQLELPLLSAW